MYNVAECDQRIICDWTSPGPPGAPNTEVMLMTGTALCRLKDFTVYGYDETSLGVTLRRYSSSESFKPAQTHLSSINPRLREQD